jgi:hypothetical protein
MKRTSGSSTRRSQTERHRLFTTEHMVLQLLEISRLFDLAGHVLCPLDDTFKFPIQS